MIPLLLLTALAPAPAPAPAPVPVRVRLAEWSVQLSVQAIAAGPVRFAVSNGGSIPHAFEIEGQGIEQETPQIQPGDSTTLALTLRAGSYEVYCPVGAGSHKKLGMVARLVVGGGPADTPAPTRPVGVNRIRVVGGGPVIQILPGPFPFPDSVTRVVASFGAESTALQSQIRQGPYSDMIAPITGTADITAWDLGATRDSVNGTAEFTTQDGAHWRLVLDRVQTKDVPHHPRFGGVILGLYYHGMTGVHTPLVPTINSAVALWAVGHLYRDGALVTDNAMTHVMLLSHTRRPPSFALACWDCSHNPIDELQLQVTPASGEAPFAAPGGVLFVNWERSSATP